LRRRSPRRLPRGSLQRSDSITALADKTLRYAYAAAGRLTRMVEAGFDGSNVATQDYTYDNRGRLIHEVRSGENIWQTLDARRDVVAVEREAFVACQGQAYDVTYTYDNGGNRKTKSSIVNGADPVEVAYHYDVDDDVDGVTTYGSFNNRLIYSITTNGV
jgi:hypothetical protein